jgi:RNA polymerase primary sigma factor
MPHILMCEIHIVERRQSCNNSQIMTMFKEDALLSTELELLRPANNIDSTLLAEPIDQSLHNVIPLHTEQQAVKPSDMYRKIGSVSLVASDLNADILITSDKTIKVNGEEIVLSKDGVFVFNALLTYKGVPKRPEELRALGFRERATATASSYHFKQTISRLITACNDNAPKPLIERTGVTKATRYRLLTETVVKDEREPGLNEKLSYVEREQIIRELAKTYREDPYVQARLFGYRQPHKNQIRSIQGDEIGRYLNEIQDYRLLTKEDEKQLFGEIDQGLECYKSLDSLDNMHEEDKKVILDLVAAREIAYNTNLRLVIRIAMHYRRVRGTMSEIDLIQEGNIGLSQAIARMNISKGYKFSTYATPWIRQAVGRALGNQSREIRLPVHLHEKYSDAVKKVGQLSTRLGREPTKEEAAKHTKMTVTQYNELMRVGRLHLPSLNQLLDENSETELGDLIARTESKVDTVTDSSEAQERLAGVLGNADLDDRELLIMGLRYGLGPAFIKNLRVTMKNGQGINTSKLAKTIEPGAIKQLADIGTILGCSAERVRQIEAEALGKLRRAAPAAS